MPVLRSTARHRRKLTPVMWGSACRCAEILRPIANRPQDAILPHTKSKMRAQSSRRAKKRRISFELSRTSGVVVSDVAPGSPADSAGIKLNDIVLTLDGKSIPNLPQFMMASLTHSGNEAVKVQILRKNETLQVDVAGVQEEHRSESTKGFRRFCRNCAAVTACW
jgi:S1-C subfamily serine protease